MIIHDIHIVLHKPLLFPYNGSIRIGLCIPIFIMSHWELANNNVFNKICEDKICDIKHFSCNDKYLSGASFKKIIVTHKYLRYLNFTETSDMKLNIWIETTDTSIWMTATADTDMFQDVPRSGSFCSIKSSRENFSLKKNLHITWQLKHMYFLISSEYLIF